MPRYLLASALLIVYVVGSALVVRREGRTYREGLTRERLAARSAATREEELTREREGERLAAVREGELKRERERLAAVREGELKRERGRLAELESAKERKRVAELEAAEERKRRAELADDPVFGTPEMKKIWDMFGVNPKDEMLLGQALHEMIMSSNRKVEVGTMQRRVEETAEFFVNVRSRKEIEYTFTVLDSDVVNAFSHPGGYVYVTSGLMDWIGNDQPFVLEFVLAHEIAHVDLQHALACLREPALKKFADERGIGTLGQFLHFIFPRGYPDKLDLDADRWAFQRMQREGRSKRECLAFLRKLEGYAADHGFGNGRKTWKRANPDPDAESAPEPEYSPIENHLRAHPAAYKRLKQLENLTKPVPAPARAR